MKRFLALLLALCALLTGLAGAETEIDYKAEYERLLAENEQLKSELAQLRALLAEENGIWEEPAEGAENVIASFDGGAVTFEEVYEAYEETVRYYGEILSGFGIEAEFTPEEAHEMQIELAYALADDKIVNNYLAENGLTLLSEDEVDVITALTQEEYAQMYAEALEYFTSTGMDTAAAQQTAQAYFEEYGLTLKDMLEDSLSEARQEALIDLLAGEVTVTEEDIQQNYAALLESDREYYTEYPGEYAFDALYAETAIAWIPEGYRRVRAVVIPFDEEAMEKYDLLYSLDQTDSPEADALFESLLPEAEGVYARLLSGESFDALRGEYPETEYYLDEAGSDSGFYLSADSEMFGAEADAAIMALPTVGSITRPQRCDWGWVIFEYAEDVPSGAVPLEEIRDELYQSAYNARRTAQYDAALEQLRQDANLTFYFERLN